MKPIRTILLGNSGVGKTCIIRRAAHGIFEDVLSPTIGAAHATISRIVNNKELVFNIWDTAGQEKYRSIVPIYFTGASIVLFVFDVTNKDSFKELSMFYEMLMENLKTPVFTVLIGNKIDLISERVIFHDEAISFANHVKAKFFIETSAKTGENVQEIFDKIIIDPYMSEFIEPDITSPMAQIAPAKSESKCC